MKIKSYRFLYVIVLMVVAFSCSTNPQTPVSTGRNAEILIYTKKSLWESELGDSLRSIFMSPQLGLNQQEATFRLLQLEELDDLFKKHRNILHVIIDPAAKEPVLQYSDDVFASPQTFVEATAANVEEMVLLLKSAKTGLFEKFRQTDYARIQRAYRMQENKPLQNEIQTLFGISMTIPRSFFKAKATNDFMWMRLETNRYSQGLMIYRTEFNDSSQLEPNALIDWKNSITKEHIPGDVEGSYMAADTLTVPYFNLVKWNNSSVMEVRGLWITLGDFMGGPYVVLFIVDPEKKFLYGFEGFVYYPSQDKRDLLLQLEAIIHSVQFDSKKK